MCQVAHHGKFSRSTLRYLVFSDEFVFKAEVNSPYKIMGTYFFQPKKTKKLKNSRHFEVHKQSLVQQFERFFPQEHASLLEEIAGLSDGKVSAWVHPWWLESGNSVDWIIGRHDDSCANLPAHANFWTGIKFVTQSPELLPVMWPMQPPTVVQPRQQSITQECAITHDFKVSNSITVSQEYNMYKGLSGIVWHHGSNQQEVIVKLNWKEGDIIITSLEHTYLILSHGVWVLCLQPDMQLFPVSIQTKILYVYTSITHVCDSFSWINKINNLLRIYLPSHVCSVRLSLQNVCAKSCYHSSKCIMQIACILVNSISFEQIS